MTVPARNRTNLYADARGSIVLRTASDGTGAQINSYDAYGIPSATNTGRFQYTGQAWLAEIGMYYYKARMYSPTLGRFLQTDPIGYEDQFNLYAYVGNDPVNGTDWMGTDDSDCVGERPDGDIIYVCSEDPKPEPPPRSPSLARLQMVSVAREPTPEDVTNHILSDICEIGKAVETIGDAGTDAGVVATAVGLVVPPVAGGAATFTELSAITASGGQLVQDLTQGDVLSGVARAGYGIFGG